MISNITIENYKSIIKVSLPLRRFNLLIGANGCGKTNILEGIALGAAASSDKLDYEYFGNRGIRIVEPRFMLPAFEDINAQGVFISVFDEDNNPSSFDIIYEKEAKPARWMNRNKYIKNLDKNFWGHGKPFDATNLRGYIQSKLGKDYPANFKINVNQDGMRIMPFNSDLEQFLIYSLEESILRRADDSNRIYPMGRHGEGLFAYLKDLSQRPEGAEIFNEIKENLKVLDWFDDMQVPSGQLSMEFNLKLKDGYLDETINTFDQRSTNEGFLYLLFYFTLVISDETPKFFAIENIDTAFNPKLCREVINRLVELAKKHDKQIIATTHNPAILDGLDLMDDEQKLMVVQRSIDGYTKVRTLKKEQVVNSDLPLSQLWLRGFIGGLPNNF